MTSQKTERYAFRLEQFDEAAQRIYFGVETPRLIAANETVITIDEYAELVLTKKIPLSVQARMTDQVALRVALDTSDIDP